MDKALTKLINFANTFQIIKAWGTGKSCAGDGTIQYIREENLIAEYHIRYGHRGGIAYHHVSDQYIALFSTFILCGVWEAVEIIEALLKNQSDIKPDTIHAETKARIDFFYDKNISIFMINFSKFSYQWQLDIKIRARQVYFEVQMVA